MPDFISCLCEYQSSCACPIWSPDLLQYLLCLQAADADQACFLLCEAVHKSHPAEDDALLRIVARACLQYGLRHSSATQLQLCPVTCCKIGVSVRHHKFELIGKLQASLDSDALRPYISMIAAPKGAQPAVLLLLTKLICKKHMTGQVKGILSQLIVDILHPQSRAGISDGTVLVSSPAQAETGASEVRLDITLQHYSVTCLP